MDDPAELGIETAVSVRPLDTPDEGPFLLTIIPDVMAHPFADRLHRFRVPGAARVLDEEKASGIGIAAVEEGRADPGGSAFFSLPVEYVQGALAIAGRRVHRAVVVIGGRVSAGRLGGHGGRVETGVIGALQNPGRRVRKAGILRSEGTARGRSRARIRGRIEVPHVTDRRCDALPGGSLVRVIGSGTLPDRVLHAEVHGGEIHRPVTAGGKTLTPRFKGIERVLGRTEG